MAKDGTKDKDGAKGKEGAKGKDGAKGKESTKEKDDTKGKDGSKEEDGLFLLEVLVDKVIFTKSPCFSDKDFRTCIDIKCPAVEPLEICDDEPSTIAKGDSPFIKTFNSGKSCLFSLKKAEVKSAMNKFPVKVSIHKSLPCGCLPTKIIMGECTIDMTKEFVEARNKFTKDPSKVSYGALKDSFHLTGADGDETGEILMFLRISCFGKLIVTQFQGAPINTNMGTGAGGSTSIIDRSCNQKKEFQTLEDPCACGAYHGQGSGKHADGCPLAVDPYNSMPCEDPDDPCYCAGSRAQQKQDMACRNTDQYCLHVPKGYVACMPYNQELVDKFKNESKKPTYFYQPNGYPVKSSIEELPLYLTKPNKKSQLKLPKDCTGTVKGIFGKNYMVYMTLIQKYSKSRDHGTQATALLNKCLQVYENSNTTASNSNYCTTSLMSTTCCERTPNLSENIHCSQVYFFGKKKKPKVVMVEPTDTKSVIHKTASSQTGVGYKDSKSGISKDSCDSSFSNFCSQVFSCSTSTTKLTENVHKKTSKSVSIKELRCYPPPPPPAIVKDNVMVTISHIKIGPKDLFTTHGSLKCYGASSQEKQEGQEGPENEGPVKVTTSNNPRRGVFELVIRRMTGAPLAKNELMLEWTPPPTQTKPPCGRTTVGPVTFIPSICCRPKCKKVVCRPSACKGKYVRKMPCYRPCSSSSCKRCGKVTCCHKPCRKRPCRPCYPPTPCGRCNSPPSCRSCCPPPTCRPKCPPPTCRSCCPPPTCKLSCTPACNPSCCGTPCTRVCPVGYKRPRCKRRTRPKIRPHRKHESPCLNRSKACPVVKCLSNPECCLPCCD